MLKNLIIATATVAMLGGCSKTTTSLTPPVQPKSMFIVMKLPSLKYADQGFVSSDGGSTNVEIYSSGVPVMKIDIRGSKICSGNGLFSCMSKSSFNSKFLSAKYPDNTFEQILLREPIFGSENMQSNGAGFIQNISKAGEFDINYSVNEGYSEFIDAQNNILIKIRDN